MRTPERTGSYSYERDAAEFSAEELAAFKANDPAWARWEREPPGYRKTATHYVMSAKREDTRARRLQTLIDDSAAGQRIGLLRRPGAE